MKRSRLILCAAAFGGALLLSVGLWLVSPTPGINERARERIRKGMSESDVEAIFGCSAGYYADAEAGNIAVYRDDELPQTRSSGGVTSFAVALHGGKEWVANDYCAAVFFDDAGKVTKCIDGRLFGRPARETFLEMVRRWLQL